MAFIEISSSRTKLKQIQRSPSNSVIKKVFQQAKQQEQQQQIAADAARKDHFLLLPYKGKRRAPYQIHEKKNIKVIIARNQNTSCLYW